MKHKKTNKKKQESPRLSKSCLYYRANRERLKRYCKELRDLSKEIGNCTKCHQPKEDQRYLWCINCRAYSKSYYARKKKQKDSTSFTKQNDKELRINNG